MRRILIIAPAWIGDTVLMQPLLRRLHQCALQETGEPAQIDVFAPPWTLPLVTRMPEVHRTLSNPFAHGVMRLFERIRLGRALRSAHYQQAIVLPNSIKSAIVPFFAKIPRRTGYVGEYRYGLLNDLHTLDPAIATMAERFTRLAEARQSPRHLFANGNPKLISTTQQQQQALAEFGLDLQKPLVILCPGAEFGPAKRWPPHHFAALAHRFIEDGATVCLLGASQDAPSGEAITKQCPTVRNLCGKTTLLQAIDLIASAAQVVSNDSGLMHIAAALNRPLLALFGSSSPEFTPPLSEKARLAHLNLECSPCFQRQCPLHHLKCLNELSVEYVWQRMEFSAKIPSQSIQ